MKKLLAILSLGLIACNKSESPSIVIKKKAINIWINGSQPITITGDSILVDENGFKVGINKGDTLCLNGKFKITSNENLPNNHPNHLPTLHVKAF